MKTDSKLIDLELEDLSKEFEAIILDIENILKNKSLDEMIRYFKSIYMGIIPLVRINEMLKGKDLEALKKMVIKEAIYLQLAILSLIEDMRRDDLTIKEYNIIAKTLDDYIVVYNNYLDEIKDRFTFLH